MVIVTAMMVCVIPSWKDAISYMYVLRPVVVLCYKQELVLISEYRPGSVYIYHW